MFLFSTVKREAANCRRISRYQMGTGHSGTRMDVISVSPLPPVPPYSRPPQLNSKSILQHQLVLSCLLFTLIYYFLVVIIESLISFEDKDIWLL